ncbi:FOG: Transposon-encoded proteins with TYA, reverse transcriptase, integrase domains in various combinations [Plasmopara halstedii]|uniref:FOG: Transposon-encoded proteins with TYA, reverse transcriptase, integrase domains in various combinations n=1 Tax=Plasmopara halstedii TaxID=4781 RepID=A0A0P1AJA7_PLAHL|nr:FOG: Transposon-encoded proteins with TYA, reverse transcriptase, integrase domains in various combinations [Plasmopara halstedii]CEG41327.1 FOG: Transposon-encoded proteins with TYA, reverse transcriptase, integrase domains in various combinations [Plasmopara halstedii]|eukprot:XP_024577696.1 FOG: Transposon-encoded proteins with TYA, reverse transcriptase, integrase domains in various combinations [Plasmopara halstedii]
MDTVGARVYIPSENTVKFVAEVRVIEDVTYGDRHHVDPTNRDDGEWLLFATEEVGEQDDTTSISNGDSMDMESINESSQSVVLYNSGDAETSVSDTVAYEAYMADEDQSADVDEEDEDEDHDSKDVGENRQDMSGQADDGHDDDKSVSANFGSEVDPAVEGSIADATEVGEDVRDPTDEQGSTHGQGPEAKNHTENGRCKDSLDEGLRKRVERDNTPSKAEKNQLGDRIKERRTGLRRWTRRPARFDDFVRWSNVATKILSRDGRPIDAKSIRGLKKRRQAMSSKHADFWQMAELEEMAASKNKKVLGQVKKTDIPKNAKTVKIKWVFAIKTHAQGFVVRFKARVGALRNYQRPVIDFMETSSPVVRISSLRITAIISAEFDLVLYGGDTSTAYLNATLEIAQYVDGIEGYSCELLSYPYVVWKALYGLRQSGRDWNSEINGWLLNREFDRCATEPCLYYLIDGKKIVPLLIYVDDVACATNNEESKIGLFAELDKAYGLKDHGGFTEFLAIEVTQTEEGVFISQEKYAKYVLYKLGFGGANKCGIPMEFTTRLAPATEDDSFDSSFDYRGALGMLMVLATGIRRIWHLHSANCEFSL